MSDDIDKSLSDEATLAGHKQKPARDVSIGDERTLGGADAAGIDTVMDDLEVVDLESRYKIEGTLGQGGMGAVLLATDTRLGRKVAIKRILGEAARSATAIQRFLTEAKAVAAINHANVVQIYDYGRAKDGPFLIMEFVEGGSLAEKCKGGALPLEEAIDLACQLCDGLGKAHDSGIIHRDIKPANVLLTKDGIPKLTDFGLAKADSSDHQMTMTGAVMGTPDFMPPEQRRDAADVDSRSDLWSLAATVYQMVTGRSPKVIRLHEVPQSLHVVLAKALEDRKDDRYQAAKEFRVALRAAGVDAKAPSTDLVQGQCPSCGAANESDRRFCRSCAEPLEAACLSCSVTMPLWEEVCGQCGSKQTPLLESRRESMEAAQFQAQAFLEDFDYESAVSTSERLREETHPKLQHLAKWGADFLDEISRHREEQTHLAITALSESLKHEVAYDYDSAIKTLEAVPKRLQSEVLPGQKRSVEGVLQRLHGIQSRIQSLETGIRQRVSQKRLDDLLPEVEELLALRPGRADVQKLHEQLTLRQQRQIASRDAAVDSARRCMIKHDYAGALAALSSVSAAMVTTQIIAMRSEADRRAATEKKLARTIEQAVAKNLLDGLLPTVTEFLKLKPGDGQMEELRQSLVEREGQTAKKLAAAAREEKLAADALMSTARELEKNAKFSEALATLSGFPWSLRDDALIQFEKRLEHLRLSRASAFRALSAAGPGGYATAISSCRSYDDEIRRARIADVEFDKLQTSVTEAERKEARSGQRLKAVITSVTTLLILIVIGLFARSYSRYSSLSSAILSRRWEQALGIDPNNAMALMGRASERIAHRDFDNAFADLDLAALQTGTADDVERIRRKLYRERGITRLSRNDFSGAFADFDEAMRRGEDIREIRESAFKQRGFQRLEAGDVEGAQEDFLAVKTLGADPSVTLIKKKEVADTIVSYLSDRGLQRLEAGDFDGAQEDLLAVRNMSTVLAVTLHKKEKLKEAVVSHLLDRGAKRFAANDLAGAKADVEAAGNVDPASAVTLQGEIVKYEIKSTAFQNSLGMKFVRIPAGRFVMDDFGERQEVTLSQPYCIGVHEVRERDWSAVMGGGKGTSDRAVTGMSWDDAVSFCEELSATPEERAAGRVYRLPTEAEWEYACRAGTTTAYSFGNDESLLGDFAWFDEDVGSRTHPVGQKKPNAWGLYDMHGNVEEWCSDWYGDYASGVVTDPRGPESGSDRVLRGGCWLYSAWSCRSGDRDWDDPSSRSGFIGFRLALSPSGE